MMVSRTVDASRRTVFLSDGQARLGCVGVVLAGGLLAGYQACRSHGVLLLRRVKSKNDGGNDGTQCTSNRGKIGGVARRYAILSVHVQNQTHLDSVDTMERR
jgi:hypothetical protein